MRLTRKKPPIQHHNLTTRRRPIPEMLQKAQGPMDAKELYRRASTRDQPTSWSTVYRSLNLQTIKRYFPEYEAEISSSMAER